MAPKTTKKKSSSKRKAARSSSSAHTTRKQAEEKVLDSRDFLRRVIDIDPHFIFAKDREGRFTLVNQAVADAYGTTIEDLIGKTDADFNPNKHEVEFFLRMDREVMDLKRERFIPEEVITDAAGKTRWLQTIKRPIIGTDGRANQVLGVSTDITERKKAEEAFRASEQRFRAIYDQTYEFIGLLKPDGTLIDANQTALAFRGLQRSDVVGKPFWETSWWDVSRELQEKLKAGIAEAATGKFVRLQAQHRAQDGEIEEIDFSLTPITDQTGRVTEIIPEGRRITPLTRALDQLHQVRAELERRVRERTEELEEANALLRASEERYRLVSDNADVGLTRLSRDWIYVSANPAYAKIAGKPLKQIVGRPMVEVLGEEGIKRIRPYVERALRGEHVVYEDEVPFVDTGQRFLHVSYTPDTDDAGQIVGWVACVTDITARKQAESLLLASEAFTRDVLDSLAAHICVLDGQGVIIRTNKPWERFAQANSDPNLSIGTVGDNYLDVCRRAIANGDATARPILAGIEAVLVGRLRLFSTEYPCHSPDEARWFHLRVSSLMERQGAVISHRDITDRKQAEESLLAKQRELEQSQARLEDLTAQLLTAQDHERERIARDLHDDFSQRVAAIVLDLAALERRPPVFPELIPTVIKPMREEVERLANDLHSLAYKLHPSMLNHLGLQPAIEDYMHRAMERTGLRISLTVKDVPDSLPLERSTCLFRVFQESLQNVAKHAKATEVVVKLSGSSKGVGLSVMDNGKGFDVRDKSRHQKGLGLTSMQERLRLLNGFLNVHSRPADGTKVCAWIPFREKTP